MKLLNNHSTVFSDHFHRDFYQPALIGMTGTGMVDPRQCSLNLPEALTFFSKKKGEKSHDNIIDSKNF